MRFIIVVMMSLFSVQAFASGFAVKDQGAKAMGLANAFTAVADDASAAWYNPAALVFQEGTSITVGGEYVIPTVSFSKTGVNTEMDKKNHFIPFVYMNYNNDLPVSIGLAINAPFGLSTDWSNAKAGFDPASGGVTFSQIKMVNINPSVSYKLNDNFSIAAGVMYYNVDRIDFDSTIVTQNGSGNGWGGNLALFYKSDEFNVGLSYRSSVKVDVKGTATAIGQLKAAGSTSVASSVTFPDMVSASVAFHPINDWTLTAQYDWVNWKTFDELLFTRGKKLNIIPVTTTVSQNWKSTSSFSAGAEWAYSDDFRARFGYAYDPTPVSDAEFSPRTADNDRHLITVGWGYSAGANTVIDVAYGYLLLNDRNQTASTAASKRNGTYKASAHLLSASMSYQF